jgi:hypothetical protein
MIAGPDREAREVGRKHLVVVTVRLDFSQPLLRA